MKKKFALLLLIFCSTFSFAQKEAAREVRFTIIDESPVYPGCETLKKDLQKLCLQKQINKHVLKNYNSKIAKNLDLDSGVVRVYIQFKIDRDGNITDIFATGPHKKLEEEGIRVINELPQMIPGKHSGENVAVKYTLPISLYVEPAKKTKG